VMTLLEEQIMLQLEGMEVFKDVTIYSDDQSVFQYYLLPQFPRFRLDNGKPAFGFVKYRNPIDREDKKKGGALAAFDIELAVDAAVEAEIRAMLQDRLRQRFNLTAAQAANVKLGRPTFTRGTVGVTIMANSETLVQRVVNAGKPSLFGNNVAAVQAEFTPEGAAVFEGVMQSKAGLAFVMVNYDLWFPARLPAISITGSWHADKFYSYSQSVDVEDNFWSDDDYTENISEYLHNSESYVFITDPGTLDMGKPENVKMVQGIEDSMRKTMDEMVKRNMLEAIPAQDRDISKIRDKGYEHIKRNMTTHRAADVSLTYNMKMAADQEKLPQGNLPALCAMTVGGKPIVWTDYAREIEADDPFFKAINVLLQVNADFASLPIFSVDVTVDYPPKTAKSGAETFSFKKADDTGKFAAFIDGGSKKYKYKYTVNYKGQAKTYEHPWTETEVKTLTVNVDDLGIWLVDIETGDMNYEQVDSAQLTVQYDDGAAVSLVEKQFTLDKDHRSAQIRELLYVPRSKPYRYSVKYFMKGGREVQTPFKEANGKHLYVNDPFSAMRTVGIRTRGDFDNDIDTIFLDLAYEDAANNYRQTKSFAFSKAGKRFDDWTFPAIDEKAGKLTYSGNILGKDGSSAPIAATEAATGTILVGRDPAGQFTVDLVSDLLDWDKVKLVIVDLAYKDEANNISLSRSVTLRKGGKPEQWAVNIKDKNKKSFTWSAKYFMADGSRRATAQAATTETELVLEPPS
jgi:hypothetical protein